MTNNAIAPHYGPSYPVYVIRGQHVILDVAVAGGFGTDTKRVNEAVRRNPEMFSDAHFFALSDSEFAALRSQSATTNTGRGGNRYAPHVFTVKGVARLATILKTDAALRATDLMIDTFLEVQRQIAAGEADIAIQQPARLRGDDDHGFAARLREKLTSAVTTLLDTVIDVRKNMPVRDVAFELGSGALENLRERLRTRGLENTKLEADAIRAMAEAERIHAEARKVHAEAEGIELDNIPKRITAVREIMALYRESEPSQIVRLLTTIDQSNATALLPARPSLSSKDAE